VDKTPKAKLTRLCTSRTRRVLFLLRKQRTQDRPLQKSRTWKNLSDKISSRSTFLHLECPPVQDSQVLRLLLNRNMQSLSTKQLSDPIPFAKTGKYLNQIILLVFPLKPVYFILYYEIKCDFATNRFRATPLMGVSPIRSLTHVRSIVGVSPT